MAGPTQFSPPRRARSNQSVDVFGDSAAAVTDTGDTNRRFRAFDQETGEALWEINLGSPVSGYPISYAVNGKQYITVNTGSAQIDLAPELRPSRGTNLFVFALPD